MNIRIDQAELMGNRLLVQRDKQEAIVSQSGLTIVAEQAHSIPPATGRVLKAGPDCKIIKVGDRVLFSPFISNELEFVLTKVLLMSEPEVVMKINDL